MALNCFLVVELLLYVVCFFCGIVTAASVAITQGEFAGKCILYGTVHLNGTNLTIEYPSSQSLCYFVTTISVCVAVYCFSLALCCCYIVCVPVSPRGQIWMCVTLLVSGVFSFFLLVTGCVLRFGRNRLCESIISLPGITRCEEAQDKPWSAPYVGTRFFSNLHGAETSVWVNFFFWLLIVTTVVIQRRRGSEFTARGEDPSASPSETEPFFPGRTRPQ
ncbi:transmembrane protein 179B-like [Conger conger]|uniref:transmembrane protein 179B-like n=1 Tax=Conger conger TaxID=82655 RepID=UPI002A5A82FA|nr:transmembrane protein 179B-like [Conger conger]